MKPMGLYLHIPFCKARCYYCDFNTYAGMETYFEEYVQALIAEMQLYYKEYGRVPIKSVFIGGGTPTILHYTQIEKIVQAIYKYFDLHHDIEFSIESNPGTLTRIQLQRIRAIGINRLSIGLQAVQNQLLMQMGRIHRFEDFLENYQTAREVGFDNINADLIFSLPSQTIDQWDESIQTLINLGLDHISCYSLILEKGTKFYNDYKKGNLTPLDDEVDRKMNDLAVEKMTKAGYHHYEISNFAKQGKECKHNILYWKAEEYFGLGLGAHGYYKGARYSNVLDMKEYISKINLGQNVMLTYEKLSLEDKIEEYMMLGLRLIDGIAKNEFKYHFSMDIEEVYKKVIDQHKKLDMLEETETHLRLTKKGIDISNTILAEFLL